MVLLAVAITEPGELHQNDSAAQPQLGFDGRPQEGGVVPKKVERGVETGRGRHRMEPMNGDLTREQRIGEELGLEGGFVAGEGPSHLHEPRERGAVQPGNLVDEGLHPPPSAGAEGSLERLQQRGDAGRSGACMISGFTGSWRRGESARRRPAVFEPRAEAIAG